MNTHGFNNLLLEMRTDFSSGSLVCSGLIARLLLVDVYLLDD
jgi:hypothetical protein